MNTILRIDMGAERGPVASATPLGRYAGLAGRPLATRIVADEVAPGCHSLDPESRLVFAPGAVAAAGGGRIAVCCKSPLTGRIAAAQAEGRVGPALARLGYAALVLSGQPPGAGLWTIVVDRSGVSFSAAAGLRAGNQETVAALRRVHAGASYLTIGPAGEMGLGAATVACADGRRGPAPIGRAGAGAVMGSKRVKAVVVGDLPGHAPGPDGPERRGAETDGAAAAIARLERDLGLDPAEFTAVVSVAVEAGLLRRGDGRATLRLLAEVGAGTPLGRVLGSGASALGEALGVEGALHREVFVLGREALVGLLAPGARSLDGDIDRSRRSH